MQESSKTMENRGKWSAVGGAFGKALGTLESKGVLKQLLSVVGLVLVDLSNVGPLWGKGIAWWSVLGGAFGEAIERLESKEARGKGIAWWSQGLEATSVSNRCYGKDWKVAGGCGWDCSRRLVFVGLRCGTIMVAKIRRNFCQHSMLWERVEWKGVREKGIAWGTSEELLSV